MHDDIEATYLCQPELLLLDTGCMNLLPDPVRREQTVHRDIIQM